MRYLEYSYSTYILTTCKLVFLNEFSWDVCDFNADILRIGHWGIKIKVLEVDGAEARAFAREHTVEEHLEEFKRCSVRANITRETDATATNGDAGTIGIVFFRTNFTNYHGVADFLSFVGGNIVIVDEKESVSARNSFRSSGQFS